MDLGIRASFSLPLQQPVLVICSTVKGALARLLEFSKAWHSWVRGGGTGLQEQRLWDSRGQGGLSGLSLYVFILRI